MLLHGITCRGSETFSGFRNLPGVDADGSHVELKLIEESGRTAGGELRAVLQAGGIDGKAALEIFESAAVSIDGK